MLCTLLFPRDYTCGWTLDRPDVIESTVALLQCLRQLPEAAVLARGRGSFVFFFLKTQLFVSLVLISDFVE